MSGNKEVDLAETARTLPIVLLRTREAVMDRFRPMLKAHDVTEQQWRVMRVLREIGPSEASQLAHHACVLGPSLSRIIKTLAARGFITSLRDEADGRKLRLALTQEGDAFLTALAPESARAYAEIESVVGQARIERLLDELNRLLHGLK